jgi:hypothetical protein
MSLVLNNPEPSWWLGVDRMHGRGPAVHHLGQNAGNRRTASFDP